ncbi:MAG: hypothetical protein MJZ34_16380, partial [Paludibacteraceae bacterium]|nr:hypothetical protein [Paludibacteraceae bacterium]
MARLPEDTELVDIYNSDETKSQLENIAEITSNDRLPVVDAETNELKNASVKQITKGLDEEELVIKLQGVTVYDGTETIEIKKDSRIQLNNGCTITIKSGAPSGGVGTKLLCMAKDGTGTVLCEDGGNRFSVPDGKYIELIYTIGGWTFYSQMVRLTLAEYEALGDRVNSDNVVYLITDDEASMDSNPTVQGLTVLNGTTLNGNLSVKGNAT